MSPGLDHRVAPDAAPLPRTEAVQSLEPERPERARRRDDGAGYAVETVSSSWLACKISSRRNRCAGSRQQSSQPLWRRQRLHNICSRRWSISRTVLQCTSNMAATCSLGNLTLPARHRQPHAAAHHRRNRTRRCSWSWSHVAAGKLSTAKSLSRRSGRSSIWTALSATRRRMTGKRCDNGRQRYLLPIMAASASLPFLTTPVFPKNFFSEPQSVLYRWSDPAEKSRHGPASKAEVVGALRTSSPR